MAIEIPIYIVWADDPLPERVRGLVFVTVDHNRPVGLPYLSPDQRLEAFRLRHAKSLVDVAFAEN